MLYRVACHRCGGPLWLPFVPTRPKLCDACFSPRSPEEVEKAEAERRRMMRQGLIAPAGPEEEGDHA